MSLDDFDDWDELDEAATLAAYEEDGDEEKVEHAAGSGQSRSTPSSHGAAQSASQQALVRPSPSSANESSWTPFAPPKNHVQKKKVPDARAMVEAMNRPEMPPLTIVSCVGHFSLGVPMDVKALALLLPNTLKLGETLVVHRLRAPRWQARISAAGNVTLYSTSPVEETRMHGKRLARLVHQRAYSQVKFKHFRIAHLQTFCQLGFKVNVEAFCANQAPEDVVRLEPSFAHILVHLTDDDDDDEEGEPLKAQVKIDREGRVRVFKVTSLAQAEAAVAQLLPSLAKHGQWW